MSHLKKILLILILSVGYFSNAQEIRISGRVIDQQENPIYFANIVLLNPNDSILVQGTSTNEDGTFALESLHSGNYILQASYIGYILYSTSLNITTDTELSDIVLKVDTQELQAVEVTKDLPVLEKKTGKLVFHVANTSLSSLSSYEILQQTPGVLTMGDVISIKNSKTTVYINNRRVYLDDSELKSFLQSYAGSNVSDIEIILNPSSKYDADSGYIINIQTNKNVSVGYKGSLEGTYKQGVYSKYGLGTNHYYKSNFLDIYAGYNINQQKWYKEDQGYIQFYQAQQLDDYWEWDMYKTSKYTSHHLNTIFDFTLDDSNFLSLSTNVSFQPNHHVDNQVQTRNYTSTRDYIGGNNALGVLENDNTNIAVNATYTKEINDRNSLSLQTNYVYYHDTSTQGLNTSFFDANEELSQENFLETDGDQQNTIFTAQGDYSMEMQTESLLDFGVKFARISSKSEMLYIGSYVPINASDDHFKYQENNLSLNVNYSKDWDTWSFQTGVRGESTSISGVSHALGVINGQDYFELFPNIGLQHQLSENHLLGIYYKRGINRSRYQSLNPYRYYINEYNFISGNPNLTRSIENRVGLEYTYSDNFIFDLYYQNIKGDLNRFSFQDNENKFLYNAYFNAEEFYQYSLDFTYYSY